MKTLDAALAAALLFLTALNSYAADSSKCPQADPAWTAKGYVVKPSELFKTIEDARKWKLRALDCKRGAKPAEKLEAEARANRAVAAYDDLVKRAKESSCANVSPGDWVSTLTRTDAKDEQSAKDVRKARLWYTASKACAASIEASPWADQALREAARKRLRAAASLRDLASEQALKLSACVPTPTPDKQCYERPEPCWTVALEESMTKKHTVPLLERANTEYDAADACVTQTKDAVDTAEKAKAAADAKVPTATDAAAAQKASKEAADALSAAKAHLAAAEARLKQADTWEKAALILDNHVGVNAGLAQRPEWGARAAVGGLGAVDGITLGTAGIRFELPEGQLMLYDIVLDAAYLNNLPKADGGHDDQGRLGFLAGARVDVGRHYHWLALGIRLAAVAPFTDSLRGALLPEVGYALRLGGIRGCGKSPPVAPIGSIRLFAAPWIPLDGAQTSVLFGAELSGGAIAGRYGDA
ncbi:MAG: hypothetical protein KC492_07130, partial [Myxococcales bacterium]|nr:hypothetical protein [Myxococcales bacterium]